MPEEYEDFDDFMRCFGSTKITKGEKRIWVKPTAKRKGHYRKVKSAKLAVKLWDNCAKSIENNEIWE